MSTPRSDTSRRIAASSLRRLRSVPAPPAGGRRRFRAHAMVETANHAVIVGEIKLLVGFASPHAGRIEWPPASTCWPPHAARVAAANPNPPCSNYGPPRRIHGPYRPFPGR